MTDTSLQVKITNKQILQIALPISASLIIPNINFITNNIFLGGLGERELGNAGTVGVFYLIFMMSGNGLENALQALISRRGGEGNIDAIKVYFSQGIRIAILFAIVGILPGEIDLSKVNLFCELSESGLNYILKDNDDNSVRGLVSYAFEADVTPGDIPAILKNIFGGDNRLNNDFSKVVICLSTPESVLMSVPSDSEDKKKLITVVYGDRMESTVFTDQIAEKNIYNHYRTTSETHQFFLNRYPLAAFAHQYSLLIRNLETEGNIIKIIFYRDKIVAMLSMNGELKIIQTFVYASPQDIVYNILNILKIFNAEEAIVKVSGNIDADSGLFKEISKYFQHVITDEGVLKHADLPDHYFSHLIAMSQCV